MSVNWVAEWDTSVDGTVAANEVVTMVPPRSSTFDNPPDNIFRVVADVEGLKSPGTVFNSEDWWNSGRDKHLYVSMVETVTDLEGVRHKTVFRSNTADGIFPGMREAQIFIFTGELTSIRPTPDRPSQWDTYHDPYIFTVPLTGSDWTFRCNRPIEDGQIIILAET